MNKALKTATGSITAQYKEWTANLYLRNAVGVSLEFDTTTNRVVLNVDKGFIARSQSLQIYFDDRLYQLFDGLPP